MDHTEPGDAPQRNRSEHQSPSPSPVSQEAQEGEAPGALVAGLAATCTFACGADRPAGRRAPPPPGEYLSAARRSSAGGDKAQTRGKRGWRARARDGPCLASPGALASERGGPSSARTPGRRRDVRSAGPGRQGRLASSPGAPYFVPSTGGRPRPSAREPVKEPQLLLNTLTRADPEGRGSHGNKRRLFAPARTR